MTYRLGNKEDINQITTLIKAAVKTMEEQGIHQWDEIYPTAEDFLRDIEKQNLYLACEDGKLAGLYVISTECDEAYNSCSWENPTESACIIHRFCISPEFQHRGIGKLVLNHIEEQLKTMKYESVRLDVFTQNPFALSLYRKSGYEERGSADWRKGRFLLMEKKLSSF